MSNKKELSQISASEAKKLSVSALAVRPNDASRFGQGGLSAAALQEWFDKLPNLVKDRFNEITRTLASTEATKYIGTDALEADNLYDVLALFCPRGTGTNDKNISDYIETLYAAENEGEEQSATLRDIVASLSSRIVQAKAERDELDSKISALDGLLTALDAFVDTSFEDINRTLDALDGSFHTAHLSDEQKLVLEDHKGTKTEVDLSPLAYDEEARAELESVKASINDIYERLNEYGGEALVPFLEQLYEGGIE